MNTQATNLVNRLRDEYVQQSARCGEEDSQERALLAQEAANEIERLRNLLLGVVGQFRKTGCTCAFPEPYCCAYAAAKTEVDRP